VGTNNHDRLARQIAFLVEADKLKSILRRTPLVDQSRLENSAEHSWHLVLAAVLMGEHVPFAFNLPHVLEMLTVHDLVEIDAGDTFAYDVAGQLTKAAREEAAADRIFGLLPIDQSARLRALWDEFEAAVTPEARVAHAMDRLQPFLQNAHASGGSWREHHLTKAQVLKRMTPIESTLPDVWPFVVEVIDACCASGLIRTES
jgi:putative hydrolase of HD superfamily